MTSAFPPESLWLRVRAKAWVESVARSLEATSPPTAVRLDDSPRWARRPDGWWQRTPKLIWSPEAEALMWNLPEYSSLEASLLLHPVLGPQMDALVGALGSAMRLQPRNFLLHVLPAPEDLAGYDFDQQWSRVCSEWLDDEVSRVTVVPFPGLVLGGGEAVVLDDRTQIAPLTDREVASALSSQCVVGTATHIGLYQEPPGGLSGLKIVHRARKVVGDQDGTAVDREIQGVFADEALRLDLAAQCLALLGHGALRMEPRLTFISEPVGTGGFSWVNNGVPITFGTETLTGEEAARLVEVWTTVVDDRFRSNKTLNLALRRLSFARHRPRADDSLIDLMIACEAFFLSDSGGELGYRLALRGAYWSDDANLTKREVFNIYKAAYTARGAIAHGAEVKPNSLKVRGNVVTLPGFVTVVENLLSRALDVTP